MTLRFFPPIDEMHTKIKSVLAQRAYSQSFLWATLALSIYFIAFSFYSLKNEERSNLIRVDELVTLAVPNLVRAAWQVNRYSLEILLESIVAQHGVRGARFSDGVSDMTVLARDENDSIWQSCDHLILLDLSNYPVGATKLERGLLELCYVGESPLVTLGTRVLPATAPIVFLSLTLAFIPFQIVRKSIVQPILHLAELLRGDEEIPRSSKKGNISDYTEIDLLYDELQARARRIQLERNTADLAFGAIRDGIVVLDKAYKIIRCNPEMISIFGGAQRDLGSTDFRIYLPEIEGLKLSNRIEVERESGQVLEVQKEPLPEDCGKQSILVIVRDLTERKRLERETLQTEKLRALGTLSGGIAHDFNNLLSVVIGNAELLELADFDLDFENKEALINDIKWAAERGADLVKQLLTFARKNTDEQELLHVDTIVSRTVALAQRTLGTGHSLNLQQNCDVLIRANRAGFETALINLIKNSCDAMVDGGVVHMETDIIIVEGERKARVLVKNWGDIIPGALLGRVLEPFFTTKSLGKGTGLGLAMVSGFVESSDGKISITSDEAEGTRVVLTFPEAEKSLDTSASSLDKLINIDSFSATHSVLVVDDRDDVRITLARQLSSIGCYVTTASNLMDVKKLHAAGHNDYDFVFCDVVLDGENGIPIFYELKHQGFEGKFYFVSGNIPDFLREKIAESNPNGVLRKPVSIDQLKIVLAN